MHRPGLPILLLTSLVVAACGGDAPETVARASPRDPDAGAAAPVMPKGATGHGGLLVDVAGHVRRPGVYRVPAGARVHEAIAAAGGPRAGAVLASLNRAAPVVDGQQVLVPGPGSALPNQGAGGGGAGAGASVSINQADAAALDALPGIGPVTAERIIAERESGGPFTGIDDLDRVPGIGPATIESLRDVATA